MEIFNRNNVPYFITKDNSIIRELSAYRNSSIKNISLAEAIVEKGKGTLLHLHKNSEEIYFILQGKGIMSIESESADVDKGDTIVIPAGARHKIRNTGNTSLIFLCICSPPYEHEDTIIFDK